MLERLTCTLIIWRHIMSPLGSTNYAENILWLDNTIKALEDGKETYDFCLNEGMASICGHNDEGPPQGSVEIQKVFDNFRSNLPSFKDVAWKNRDFVTA